VWGTGSVQPVDQHLQHLRAEIAEALDRVRGKDERDELTALDEQVEQADQHGLRAALNRAETRFEADHPSLAGAIRQTLSALSDAGF
jgi:hypothetical protein